MNKRYRLSEIEEAVSEMEELIGLEDDIAEIDDDFQIVVSGWSVYVESLNLTLRQGIACVWDAAEGLFMADFDVTIVYEGNIETQERLYYEQDGMVVTLGNLAMNVQLDKEKHMENAKAQEQIEPERAEAERVEAEVVYSPMVAEPQ